MVTQKGTWGHSRAGTGLTPAGSPLSHGAAALDFASTSAPRQKVTEAHHDKAGEGKMGAVSGRGWLSILGKQVHAAWTLLVLVLLEQGWSCCLDVSLAELAPEQPQVAMQTLHRKAKILEFENGSGL